MSNTQEAARQVKPVAPKVKELVESLGSFILATVDENGNPTASYAPFVQIGNDFYTLVSFMAKHTRNLAEGRKVSVMFIEDESATKQIYARDRLTIDVATSQVERDSEEWNNVIEKLTVKHGKVVGIISGMTDFIMIKMQPTKGSYVNGFGSAYFVDEKLEVTEHRNDINHETK